MPATYHINDQPDVYLERGEQRKDIYFRRFATVPIKLICSPQSMGVLVLTSMQDEAFTPNVIDSLKFVSTIATNFVTSYNMCRQRQSERDYFGDDEELEDREDGSENGSQEAPPTV